MAKNGSRKERKPPPQCKAILLCDQTIVDASTGKISIIGIINEWTFQEFPHQTQPFTCFLELTDGIGDYAISVDVYDLNADQIIAQTHIAIVAFSNPRTKVDLIIPISPLMLQHPGSYDVVVLADGQEIDRQQFQAIENTGDPTNGPET